MQKGRNFTESRSEIISLDDFSKPDPDDFELLLAANTQLRVENASLHLKNRALNAQLNEAHQKMSNLQNRLQISQQRNQESEAQLSQLQSKCQSLRSERDAFLVNLTELKSRNDILSQAIRSLEADREATRIDITRFCKEISRLTGLPVSTLGEVSALVAELNANGTQVKSEIEPIPDIAMHYQKAQRKNDVLRQNVQQLAKQNQKLESMVATEMRRNTEALSEVDSAR
jgi:chromosome segregation ATPase